LPPIGTATNIKPSQQLMNPFGSNLTDDTDGDERRLSIPLSLFIPRSARRDSTKASSEEGSDDHVR
jgi:hypothetical protein